MFHTRKPGALNAKLHATLRCHLSQPVKLMCTTVRAHVMAIASYFLILLTHLNTQSKYRKQDFLHSSAWTRVIFIHSNNWQVKT